GAAANPNDDFVDSLVQRAFYQLAGAKGGGVQRIKLFTTQQPQPGGIGHFNHRRLAIVNQSKPGTDFSSQRIMDFGGHNRAAAFSNEQSSRSISPVTNRKTFTSALQFALLQPIADGFRRGS